MHTTTLLAVVTAMASIASATPLAKRSFAPGTCGIHVKQSTRTNNDDYVEFTVKDNDGATIGSSSGGLADADPQTINSYLPEAIQATQPADSHDVDLSYVGYNFGSSNGCSVGDWDDGNGGTRQMDCSFSC